MLGLQLLNCAAFWWRLLAQTDKNKKEHSFLSRKKEKVRASLLLSLSDMRSFSPQKSCLPPKCDSFISEGDAALGIHCNLWTNWWLICCPTFQGFCNMSMHPVNARFWLGFFFGGVRGGKKKKRKQKLPSSLSMSNLSKSYWDTQRHGGNFPFHKMRTCFKYFLPTFSKQSCMKWRGNDTLTHWKGDYVKLAGEASRVNANTSMILFISCYCARGTCASWMRLPKTPRRGAKVLLQDALLWFANKYDTQKITLKEWRAWSSFVLNTPFHLKLMRAVSSLDNKTRQGFCAAKGAGDT